MNDVVPDFARLKRDLDEIRTAIAEIGADAWVLYDLHARNGVTAGLTGAGDLSRRYFVVIPAKGDPVAITHGIEQGPWAQWPWRREVYVGWQPLQETLRSVLGSFARVAMEVSPGDAVPAIDLVPAGVAELVRAAGPEVIPSGDLITRFYARWTPDQLASHRRASAALRDVAHAQLARLAVDVAHGVHLTDGQLHGRVVDALTAAGVGVGADCIAANGVNAANPHFASAGGTTQFRAGDIVLLDLWAKEAEESVYADQTWMAYLGKDVPARAAQLFGVIRSARDAAVEFLVRAWKEGRPVAGGEVDDVSRGVIRDAGFADHFIHRTGHSIDRDTHGMGPNIDNLETREVRRLIPGVAFSIEPGLYFPGEIGLRTEINVYMGEHGPEVTTPDPQEGILALNA